MNMLLKLALGSLLQNGLEKRKEMKMGSTEVGGVVRAIVSALGGVLVATGLIDNETAMTLGGAIVPLVVAVWSVLSKRKA